MASTSTTTPLSTIDHNEALPILTIHRDIVQHNILSRLDGLSLAFLTCTSSYFSKLSSEDSLWRNICISTWPSVDHPRVYQLISAVAGGHYGFFSDSFPLLTPHDHPRNPTRQTLPHELISAVDIWYKNKIIFSRVIETKTKSGEFLHSSFRLDLLDTNEILPATRVRLGPEDHTWITLRELEENLTLSWILYDPITKRSANFSSIKPVSSERHWLPGEYDVEYTIILGSERTGYMECKVVVMCGGLDHGELHLREACLQVKDMGGRYLNGKESLACLVNAIEFGKRKRRSEQEVKKMHDEFLRRKRLRWDTRVLWERTKEIAYGVVCFGVGVVYVVGFTLSLVAKSNKFLLL